MKSYCKGLVIDEAVVREAYELWASGQAGRKNAHRVAKEHGSADELIAEIVREIRGRCLATAPIGYRMRREPNNGKLREIAIESVKQQVMDYVAVLCMRPFIDARMGYYQTASVPGKGQVFAKRRLERWSKEGGYFVKTDIRKCYPSTRKEVCMAILRKYVRSDDVLYLCDYIMGTYKKGLNIGAYFALEMENIVLSFAYHHVEGLHKVRRGRNRPLVRHQLWFMDDCVMFGPSKRDLRAAVRSMCRYCREVLGLELKPWKVCKVGCEPLTMVGYTVWPDHTRTAAPTFIRAKHAFSRFLRKPILRLARRVCSYYGWMKHSDTWGFMVGNGIYKAVRIARRVVSSNDRRYACSM